MSTQDLDVEESSVGACIRAVLTRFEARPLNDTLVAELAEALNQELVSFRAGSRIELSLDGSAIRVELTPERAIETGADKAAAPLLCFEAVAAALAA